MVVVQLNKKRELFLVRLFDFRTPIAIFHAIVLTTDSLKRQNRGQIFPKQESFIFTRVSMFPVDKMKQRGINHRP